MSFLENEEWYASVYFSMHLNILTNHSGLLRPLSVAVCVDLDHSVGHA